MKYLILTGLIMFIGCNKKEKSLAREKAEVHAHANDISKFIDSISKKIQIEQIQLVPPKGAIFPDSVARRDTTGNYLKYKELEKIFNRQMDSVKEVLSRVQQRYLYLDSKLK